jgi:hypothetical protein
MDRSAEMIADMATILQDVRLPSTRTAEIAAEVGRLNAAICRAADRLAFDDDPAAYAALLARTGS